jgi:hypothetical protein
VAAAARDISTAPSAKRRGRPRTATTPEEREKQLQNKAFDLAERQLDAGTASSQVITALMKGGGVREQLELEKLRRENVLLQARAEAMENAVRIEVTIEAALEAFRTYSGDVPSPDED